MFKLIKLFLISVILVFLLGLWMGVNIGKKKPLFSNPFKEKTLQEKLIDTVNEVKEKKYN